VTSNWRFLSNREESQGETDMCITVEKGKLNKSNLDLTECVVRQKTNVCQTWSLWESASYNPVVLVIRNIGDSNEPIHKRMSPINQQSSVFCIFESVPC
jgi:hypothetical protein